MILQPATLTILITALALALLGVILVRRAMRAGESQCPSPGCGSMNPPKARFCGHCGAELTPKGPRRSE